MPFIAANGLLVLVPCAIVLDLWAVELAAGAINLALMALNPRDGLRLPSLQVQHSAR